MDGPVSHSSSQVIEFLGYRRLRRDSGSAAVKQNGLRGHRSQNVYTAAKDSSLQMHQTTPNLAYSGTFQNVCAAEMLHVRTQVLLGVLGYAS